MIKPVVFASESYKLATTHMKRLAYGNKSTRLLPGFALEQVVKWRRTAREEGELGELGLL